MKVRVLPLAFWVRAMFVEGTVGVASAAHVEGTKAPQTRPVNGTGWGNRPRTYFLRHTWWNSIGQFSLLSLGLRLEFCYDGGEALDKGPRCARHHAVV